MANFLPKYGLKSLIFAHEIFRRLTFLARPEGLSAITISRSKKKTSLEIHFIHEFRDFSSFLFIFYKKRNQNISVFITSWGPLTAKFKGKCPISRNFDSVCKFRRSMAKSEDSFRKLNFLEKYSFDPMKLKRCFECDFYVKTRLKNEFFSQSPCAWIFHHQILIVV